MAALGFLLCFLFTSTCLALQTCCAAGSLDPLPSANLSTVWISRAPDQSDYEKATYPSVLLPLASPDYRGLSFGAGFCCLSPCSTFVFGVYAMASSADQSSTSNAHLYVAGGHQVLIVWSANYDRQVRQNATLNFTGDGDLVLRDADGSLVWSSNTSGRSVVGMKITEAGNLVLHDQDNVTVWQSFDYPVDALLPGQRLLAGKSLTPVMSTNLATSHHQFYVTLRPDGVYAFAGYREPRLYYRSTVSETNGLQYMTLMNGSLVAFTVSRDKGYQIEIFGASRSLQCVRLELDGHLKLYEWNSYQWVVVQDIMKLDQCNYPSVCGDYGICSGGQCTCPTTASSTSGTYFKQLDGQKPNLGCGLNTPISCQPIEDHQLVAVSNVSYFNYIDQNAGLLTDEESCKKVCLGNCSCQAALFRYDIDPSNGSCLLVSEVLSLVGSSSGSAFLKVQITHPPRLAKKRVVLPSAIGGGIAGLVVIATAFAIMRWRQNKEESDEDEFLQLPGMPKRVPDIGGYEQAVDPWLLRPLTTPGHLGLSFGAGFYCISPCDTFIFGVYAIYTGYPSLYSDPNEYELVVRGLVVWSANRDRQVRQDATLNFTRDGDLVLRDADGSLVWSSNTSGRSVVGVNMMESGNLVLFDHHNVTVWQSFDYPVETLLPGQRLLVGQSLTPNMSSVSMTGSNQFYFTLRPDGIYAFAGYREPRLYYRNTDTISGSYSRIGRHAYMTLMNGSLDSASEDEAYTICLLQRSQSLQCLRFESDGHLRLYEWMDTQWKTVQDVLELEQRDYPSVCGDYGICFSGQCSCPMASSTSGTYFRQLDDHKPSLGCILDTPISCQYKEDHQLIQVHNVSYFSYIDQTAGVLTDEESCKQACLGNCSCRAALYHYHKTASNGSCLLVSDVLSLQVLSLVGSSPGSAFLKVQIAHPKKRGVLPYTLGGVTAALVVFTTVFAILRCRRNEEESNEDEFSDLPGMPTRTRGSLFNHSK
ncbi:hypothetical protein C2845_PM07G38140 [Panicum miliaceum]|uniref:non-specific serine/threonine protein kinase n=1 Tax=Panicum miliaceum TaxID=4540 RepID=A0A3L6SHN4_PANMI|nr:hypothetical protein C2845_PM07G38140 [Panicum miliaceum]